MLCWPIYNSLIRSCLKAGPTRPKIRPGRLDRRPSRRPLIGDNYLPHIQWRMTGPARLVWRWRDRTFFMSNFWRWGLGRGLAQSQGACPQSILYTSIGIFLLCLYFYTLATVPSRLDGTVALRCRQDNLVLVIGN